LKLVKGPLPDMIPAVGRSIPEDTIKYLKLIVKYSLYSLLVEVALTVILI